MFLSVGDILQLSRLAADLYTKGWLVARDAPQEFRDLVHELLLLKDVLFVVHRKIALDSDLYGDPTRRVLQRCFDTLSEFSSLVQKYEKLGKLLFSILVFHGIDSSLNIISLLSLASHQ